MFRLMEIDNSLKFFSRAHFSTSRVGERKIYQWLLKNVGCVLSSCLLASLKENHMLKAISVTDAPVINPAQPFNLPQPPTFNSVEEERLHRKQRLAAAFRLFAKFGFD